MSSDPFERARQKKEKELSAEAAEKARSEKEGELVISRIDGVLRPKFRNHGYHYAVKPLYIEVSPTFPGDVSYPFAISWQTGVPTKYSGLKVRDQWGGGNGIFEYNCSEERVLELAGNFFARTIATRKWEQEKIDSYNKPDAATNVTPPSGFTKKQITIAVIIIIVLVAIVSASS